MRTTGSVAISSWNSTMIGWSSAGSSLASTLLLRPASHASNAPWSVGSQPPTRCRMISPTLIVPSSPLLMPLRPSLSSDHGLDPVDILVEVERELLRPAPERIPAAADRTPFAHHVGELVDS